MTIGGPKATFGVAVKIAVVLVATAVPHPTRHIPNNEIYCKTNGFLTILMSSRRLLRLTWELMGHTRGVIEVNTRHQKGPLLQMLIFHWFYKHFRKGCFGLKSAVDNLHWWICLKRGLEKPQWGPKKELPAPLDYFKINEKPLVL